MSAFDVVCLRGRHLLEPVLVVCVHHSGGLALVRDIQWLRGREGGQSVGGRRSPGESFGQPSHRALVALGAGQGVSFGVVAEVAQCGHRLALRQLE